MASPTPLDSSGRSPANPFHRRAWTVDAPAKPRRTAFDPALDVSETEREVCVRVDLPGLRAGDVDLSAEGEALVIKGVRRLEPQSPREIFHKRGRPSGAFEIRLHLPEPFEPKDVRADYDCGVLSVLIPKADRPKPIPVRTGDARVDALLT